MDLDLVLLGLGHRLALWSEAIVPIGGLSSMRSLFSSELNLVQDVRSESCGVLTAARFVALA